MEVNKGSRWDIQVMTSRLHHMELACEPLAPNSRVHSATSENRRDCKNDFARMCSAFSSVGNTGNALVLSVGMSRCKAMSEPLNRVTRVNERVSSPVRLAKSY